jgi:acetyl esterase/lipase
VSGDQSGFPGRVDPEVAAVLADLPLDLSRLSLEDLPALRTRTPPPPPAIAVLRSEHVVPAEHRVTVHVHRPAQAGPALGCIVWVHGGGYLIGSPQADAVLLDRWCDELGCVVVSVDYRLAPEHPYPAALDDCAAALSWVHEQAEELGVDPARTGVAGSSAGAGLAAALALRTRDEGTGGLAFQLLLAPMLDDRRTTPSARWTDAPVWPRHANGVGWAAYLGGLSGGDVPPHAAASRASDLSSLPATLVMVGAADGFFDECVEYARRLVHAGVPTELQVYDGAPHAFMSLSPGTAVAQRASRDAQEWLGRRLGMDEHP